MKISKKQTAGKTQQNRKKPIKLRKTSKSTISSPKQARTAYRRKRNFSKTVEPVGGAKATIQGPLTFVIQKHAARHLHFDLRLELDGVMKSWAVPKGPSLDPANKRLAMQVEDHPIEYNLFEGTIPEGEYGGGTVMLWDQGTYRHDEENSGDLESLRQGYAKGDLKLIFAGKRLKGAWALVRMQKSDPKRPQWLLIKRRDAFADSQIDMVEKYQTSVTTGRTMEEIAIRKTTSAPWQSVCPRKS
ncbi:MAG: DNA ligase [Desulfobacteraceae bacterium]|nr:MAG: DNA ligase [Desulfobacteraceae bacterium]